MGGQVYSECVSVIEKLENQIETTGMVLEAGADFRYFKEITKGLSQKTEIGPKFNPDNKDFDEDAALWIIGRDPSGEVVHTQAVCIEDLQGTSLSSYLKASFTDFIPFATDPRTTRYLPGPGAQLIRGTACYHGEFWLKGGENGFRGDGLAAPLTRLGLLYALHEWSPDYIFAFIKSEIICKGLAARAGFMHTEPDSITWSRLGDEKINKTWTAWLTREEIRHLMKLTAMDLDMPSVESVVNIRLKMAA